jgi:hypothetical protein
MNGSNSFGSFPDGQGFDRRPFYYVTPGAANDGRGAPLVILINEWVAANSRGWADPVDGDDEDWFELYNPGSTPVNLAGFYLTDTLATPFDHLITANGPHIVPPGGYLLVWADEEVDQNLIGGVPGTDLHVDFKLGAGGEEIGLFAADGTLIDSVSFGQQAENVSMGRYPDGSATIVSMPNSASPRAPNYLAGGNTAPALAPIGGRTIFLGQSLNFVATATDPEAPPQTLSFSLDMAPAGAAITSAGAFSWPPAAAGTFAITVRVTDTGTPPLSDTETIAVDVLPLPRLGAVRNGTALELSWAARAGHRYAIDYKDALNAVAWTPLWTNTASGNLLSFTNSTMTLPQRFFRLRAGLNDP